MLANLLFYVPIGFLGMFIFSRRRGRQIAWIVLGGLMLSTAMEWTQLYLPTRDSNVRDLLCNTAGTVLGCILAFAFRKGTLRLITWKPRVEVCLLISLWVLWQLFPFIPALRRYKIREVLSQLPVWTFHAVEFGDLVLAALVLYVSLRTWEQKNGLSAVFRAATLVFPVLLGQSLINGLEFSNERLVASAAGLLLAVLLWRQPLRAHWSSLAGVLLLWVIFRKPEGYGSFGSASWIREMAGRGFFCTAVVVGILQTKTSVHRDPLAGARC